MMSRFRVPLSRLAYRLTANCVGAAMFAVLAGPAHAGVWQDEVAVTADPVFQTYSALAVGPDDAVYAMWLDWTDFDNSGVYVNRSDDRGQTWSQPLLVAEGKPYDNIALAADEGGLHALVVRFRENREGEFKTLYYARSRDGGETFSRLKQIGTRDRIEQIRIFSIDGVLYVFAANWVNENPEYFLYHSDDRGRNWTELPITGIGTVEHPDIDVRDGVIRMVYNGFLHDPGIKYALSTDNGRSWIGPFNVSGDAGPHAQLPQIAVEGSAVHVVFEDDRAGHFNVSYVRTDDNGRSWTPAVQLNQTYYGARPQLLADDEGLQLLWCQYHGNDGWPNSWSSGDYGILWHRMSRDGGRTWTDEFRVSQNEHIQPINLPKQGANYVKVAPLSRGFATLWQDRRDGNFDLYARTNDGGGVPCDAVRRLRAKCSDTGKLKAIVKLRDAEYDGERVLLQLDVVPWPITVQRRKAVLKVPGVHGPHTISLARPGQCEAPVEVNCG